MIVARKFALRFRRARGLSAEAERSIASQDGFHLPMGILNFAATASRARLLASTADQIHAHADDGNLSHGQSTLIDPCLGGFGG